MKTTPIVQKAPTNIFQPSVEFNKDAFDTLIAQKGYKVTIEKALKCPCRSKDAGNQQLSSCHNCGGSGWIFINPTNSQVILHSMNLSTKYKEWTEENRGTVSITVRDVDALAFMDKITVLNAPTTFTQVLFPKQFKNTMTAFTVYDIKSVIDLFMFKSTEEPLERLVLNADYTISSNKVLFDKRFKDIADLSMTIRYKHDPVFYVIDLSREIMYSPITDQNGSKVSTPFPIHAVAKRAHYTLDASNFLGDRIINNSYPQNC